jgi:hypothetical protein
LTENVLSITLLLKPHGSHVTELLTELAESVTVKNLGSDSGDNPRESTLRYSINYYYIASIAPLFLIYAMFIPEKWS